MSDTFERVADIVKGQLGVSEVNRSHTLANLGADSLDQVEILMEIEEEFDVDIPDDDFDRIKTIDDLVYMLEAKKGFQG